MNPNWVNGMNVPACPWSGSETGTIFPIGGLRGRFETNGYRFASSYGQLLRLVSIFSSAVPDKNRLQHVEKQSHLQFQLVSSEGQGPDQTSVLTCDANSYLQSYIRDASCMILHSQEATSGIFLLANNIIDETQ